MLFLKAESFFQLRDSRALWLQTIHCKQAARGDFDQDSQLSIGWCLQVKSLQLQRPQAPNSSQALLLIKASYAPANSVQPMPMRLLMLLCRLRILWFYGCPRAPNGPIYAISNLMASSPHTLWTSGFLSCLFQRASKGQGKLSGLMHAHSNHLRLKRNDIVLEQHFFKCTKIFCLYICYFVANARFFAIEALFETIIGLF